MIIATLRMGLNGEQVLTMNEHGIWESENRPTLAELLNLKFETSPRMSYMVAFGSRQAYYARVAKKVAEQYHAQIELTPIPRDTTPYPPGAKR